MTWRDISSMTLGEFTEAQRLLLEESKRNKEGHSGHSDNGSIQIA